MIPYYTTNSHNENLMKWYKKIVDVQFSHDDPWYFVIRKFSIYFYRHNVHVWQPGVFVKGEKGDNRERSAGVKRKHRGWTNPMVQDIRFNRPKPTENRRCQRGVDMARSRSSKVANDDSCTYWYGEKLAVLRFYPIGQSIEIHYRKPMKILF